METRRMVAAGCVAGAAVTWASAWVLRRQHRLVLALEAARDALAESAAAAERARIGREVHDVIAHSLTVTMLHVAAARLAVQDRPEDAIAALAEAERLGRQSLADVRHAVGALGDVGPPPSVDDLAALIEEYRAAGVDVALTLSGPTDRLYSAISMALYRIAEESLANAARHAPRAHVDVDLRIEPRQATLNVVNGPGRTSMPPPEPTGGGLGLNGMRQRAELVGGRLVTAAAADGGGWRVAVEVPLEDDGS